ncbi:hypothetical protein CFC21_064597 [Triticum aestivum]|uniref:Uncharacterized protein n=2 Tax=Triticum aestivum TaxID=4565 RepID=A0A9R1KKM2_WHEAT|nr:hypothetical protein CFC21_064597 [Triticum aestivum]
MCAGDLRPPWTRSQDGAALHLAQQGQQPVREPEGVKGHLLAGGHHPLLLGREADKECDTVQKCYISLSQQVKEKLGKIDPYFIKLADAMVIWIEARDMLNSKDSKEADANGKLKGK